MRCFPFDVVLPLYVISAFLALIESYLWRKTIIETKSGKRPTVSMFTAIVFVSCLFIPVMNITVTSTAIIAIWIDFSVGRYTTSNKTLKKIETFLKKRI